MLNLNVVCIDDEQDILMVIKDNLELMVSQVATYTNQAEALAYIAQHPPDVVLMDYRMPDRDGVALARAIRPKVPVIMVSGDVDFRLEEPFIGFFQKPLDFAKLEQFLESYFA